MSARLLDRKRALDGRATFPDEMESLLYVVLYCALLWQPHNVDPQRLTNIVRNMFDSYEEINGVRDGGSGKLANSLERMLTGSVRYGDTGLQEWLDTVMDLRWPPRLRAGYEDKWSDTEQLEIFWSNFLKTHELTADNRYEHELDRSRRRDPITPSPDPTSSSSSSSSARSPPPPASDLAPKRVVEGAVVSLMPQSKPGAPVPRATLAGFTHTRPPRRIVEASVQTSPVQRAEASVQTSTPERDVDASAVVPKPALRVDAIAGSSVPKRRAPNDPPRTSAKSPPKRLRREVQALVASTLAVPSDSKTFTGLRRSPRNHPSSTGETSRSSASSSNSRTIRPLRVLNIQRK